jgi:hypothetical protein
MDQFDRAQQLEEADRERCLAAARNRPSLPACGCCYNCNQPLPAGNLFCERDCRDDYEKRHRK